MSWDYLLYCTRLRKRGRLRCFYYNDVNKIVLFEKPTKSCVVFRNKTTFTIRYVHNSHELSQTHVFPTTFTQFASNFYRLVYDILCTHDATDDVVMSS